MSTSWISTQTQMPDRNVWVLVCGPRWLFAGIGCWDGEHWQQDAGQILNDLVCATIDWADHEVKVEPFNGVTHWMPLPAAYKEPTR